MFDLDYIVKLIDTDTWVPYAILLVWTFLEGETIVIIAGIAAQDGSPRLHLVILASFCGSLCSDQLMFFLGRLKGKAFVANRPVWKARAEKVYRLLEKYQTALILGFRFLYGVRNVTPLAIGMSAVTTRRFITLNVIGAAVWATTFACGGYLFGAAMERLFESRKHKLMLVGVILIIVFALWLFRIIRRRRAKTARQASEFAARQADQAAAQPSRQRDA
jgi:membrane protein DedA with SNARE-associated domain